ncbi:hypothetical protein OF122_10205 [Pelagibacterium flavum]|uniref:Uncharacterized protein n=1 Tax=Pelagibacterium flavum TaxID=2984530 RepID=A0ABY6IIM0_9HYPH|nr:hypothetical protein [Pelagibacterium sp. YIM 151497]UYQ70459.1 hypothetical protein OF122_10205 [Pelagibacterium sp. YIM 151497]|tara:strand:+ start:2159 stop:2440 length:282 start_codon:yes stop_codon:yes gene_type:complete
MQSAATRFRIRVPNYGQLRLKAAIPDAKCERPQWIEIRLSPAPSSSWYVQEGLQNSQTKSMAGYLVVRGIHAKNHSKSGMSSPIIFLSSAKFG